MTWRSPCILRPLKRTPPKPGEGVAARADSGQPRGRDEARKLFAKIRGTGSGLSGADELKLLKLNRRWRWPDEGEKAIQTLEQIIQKDPLDGEALLLAGDYFAKNGQREKAEFRYQPRRRSGFEADAFVKHAQC